MKQFLKFFVFAIGILVIILFGFWRGFISLPGGLVLKDPIIGSSSPEFPGVLCALGAQRPVRLGGPFGVYLVGHDAPIGSIRGFFTKEVSVCESLIVFNPFALILNLFILWFIIKLWHRLIIGKKVPVVVAS